MREHWTPSLSVVGAADWGGLRVDGGNASLDRKTSWAAGLALEIPISRHLAIEPQLQYARWRVGQAASGTSFPGDATPTFLSLPVLLKLHLGGHDGQAIALLFGPQVDWALSLDDTRNVFSTGDLAKPSLAATAGIELLPRARLSIFARYIHGFTNLDDTANPNTVSKYYLQGVQAGLRVRLGGGRWMTPPPPPAPVVAPAPVAPPPPTDRDGDGIMDGDDRCPTERGVVAYGGCPVPDGDRDGIADDVDRCPTVAGVAAYGGCPVPDSDRDGIADDTDRCPAVAGTARMLGCPEIAQFDPHEVTFATNRAVLTAAGKRELDLVIDWMRTHATTVVSVEGHTDSTGSPRINQPLSERRAEAAMRYLTGKGIPPSRLAQAGFGATRPVADNTTRAGRAKNRRVEIIVR
jgi:outer membrane protein OmpA-like peptidoglycan-associated protein